METAPKLKKKAGRNRTLTLSNDEQKCYFHKCLNCDYLNNHEPVLDVTICGDVFDCLPKLQHGSIDLLIVDPPYNLTKDYHGNRFKESDNETYESFTRKWIELCLPLLKKDDSVYVLSLIHI